RVALISLDRLLLVGLYNWLPGAGCGGGGGRDAEARLESGLSSRTARSDPDGSPFSASIVRDSLVQATRDPEALLAIMSAPVTARFRMPPIGGELLQCRCDPAFRVLDLLIDLVSPIQRLRSRN